MVNESRAFVQTKFDLVWRYEPAIPCMWDEHFTTVIPSRFSCNPGLIQSKQQAKYDRETLLGSRILIENVLKTNGKLRCCITQYELQYCDTKMSRVSYKHFNLLTIIVTIIIFIIPSLLRCTQSTVQRQILHQFHYIKYQCQVNNLYL